MARNAQGLRPAGSPGEMARVLEAKGYFHSDPIRRATPYTIVIPPPNVTGRCTWGTRSTTRCRTCSSAGGGCRASTPLWMPGTDHAGIATQAVVERRLLRRRKEDPPRHRPRGTRRAHLEMEGRIRSPHPRPAPATRLLAATGSARASRSTRCAPRRAPDVLQAVQGRPDLPRQTPGQLGHASANRRRRRRDLHEDDEGRLLDVQVSGDRSAQARTSRVHHASPPPAPKRCSATPPSACIPPTSATST